MKNESENRSLRRLGTERGNVCHVLIPRLDTKRFIRIWRKKGAEQVEPLRKGVEEKKKKHDVQGEPQA